MSSLDPFAHDDAAYVLGALSPARRRDFEEHLAECAACTRAVRELAGIPGLLARLDESAFAGPAEPTPVPENLLPQLLTHVRRRRRRGRLVASAGAAAALVLAVVLAVVLTGVLLGGPGSSPQPTSPARPMPMTQVDQHRLSATVALQDVAWGTRIHLTCTYDTDDWGDTDDRGAASPPSYALVVHTRDGASQQIATWRAVPGRTTKIDAATDAEPGHINAVDVVLTGSGRRVLSLHATGS